MVTHEDPPNPPAAPREPQEATRESSPAPDDPEAILRASAHDILALLVRHDRKRRWLVLRQAITALVDRDLLDRDECELAYSMGAAAGEEARRTRPDYLIGATGKGLEPEDEPMGAHGPLNEGLDDGWATGRAGDHYHRSD